MIRLALLSVLLVSLGCASFQKEKGHDQVAKLVQERIGARTGWEKGTPEAEEIARRVDSLLEGGLTAERAVEIALINNPSLQQTYEELGVSQAELIEAGLFENPTLDVSLGFTDDIGAVNEWEAGIARGFLNLFLMPLRRSVAEEQFVADALRVAHETLGVAAEVQKAVVALQLREQLFAVERSTVDAREAGADLAQRQHRAGNITDLELAMQKVAYEQSRADLSEAELAMLTAREELNRLLGLWGPRTGWKLQSELPALPAAEALPDDLERHAIRQRLDLVAARKTVTLLGNALGLARNWWLFGTVEVGVHGHQDADGPRLFGPTLTLELPIFNQRQGTIAALESQLRVSERRLAAVSIDARSEVRLGQARLTQARALATHLKDVVLPLRDQVLEQSMLQYNGMQIGLPALLDAKQEQLESYRHYLRALEGYWAARADLERTVGGRLPSPTSAVSKEVSR